VIERVVVPLLVNGGDAAERSKSGHRRDFAGSAVLDVDEVTSLLAVVDEDGHWPTTSM
jgi:hypothetical protein